MTEGKNNFPLLSLPPLPSSFLPLSFFLQNVHIRNAYPVDVCQTISVFISRFVAPLHVR